MKSFIFTVILSISGFFPISGGDSYLNIRVKQADKLIRGQEGKGDLLILDVRTPGEFAKGCIRGAVNIDYWGDGFTDSVSRLDKGKLYLVYCTSGVRSGGAMKKMRGMGFHTIYNLKGGMIAWKVAKLPVVRAEVISENYNRTSSDPHSPTNACHFPGNNGNDRTPNTH